MTKDKTRRWALVDVPAQRLLDEIGAPDLEYYSAADERTVDEALRAWPLLAAVARTLQGERAARRTQGPKPPVDPPLRVIVPAADPDPADEIEEVDPSISPAKEPGR
jgi:hypothetical protein